MKEKRSSKLLSPAVISLAHLPEEDSLGSTLENLFLGTPTLQDRPKVVGRLASVNDRPQVAVFDQLASQDASEDESGEENPQLQKLRRILLKAM